MKRRIISAVLALLMIVALVMTFANASEIYSDNAFAAAVRNSSTDAIWQITGYTPNISTQSATVEISVQTKDHLAEAQPDCFTFYMISNQQVTLSPSAKIVSVNETTKNSIGTTLATLPITTEWSNQVSENQYYWMKNSPISSGYAYRLGIAAYDLASLGAGRWVITLLINNVNEGFNACFGIQEINNQLPGTFAWVYAGNTTTGYTFTEPNRWLTLPQIPTEHTITYVTPDNGVLDFAETKVPSGSAIGTAGVPDVKSPAGYYVVGYYIGETKYTAEELAAYVPTTDVTVVVRSTDKAKEWVVTFDPQGGSAVPAVEVTKGQSTTISQTSTKPGYTFDGWYTAPTGGNKVSGSYTPSADTTLYAHWTQIPAADVTVTFDPQGGSAVNDITGKPGTQATLPNTSKDGYTFDGWYTAPTGGTKVNSPYTLDSNTKLYAHWTQIPVSDVTATLDPQGGSAVDNVTGKPGTQVTLPDTSKDGYTFDGWYTAPTGGTKVDNPYTLNGNTNLYAHWTQITPPATEYWTITFSANGGSAVSSIRVVKGQSATINQTSTKAGSTFAGWYLDNNTFTQRVSGSYTPNGNVTLYAKWTANKIYHTITFVPNNGTTIPPMNVEDGTIPSLPANPSKPNFVFGGWYLDAGCTQKYDPSKPLTSDVTLYAHWVPKTGDDDVATGDSTNMLLLMGGLTLCVAAAGAMIAYKRKKINTL